MNSNAVKVKHFLDRGGIQPHHSSIRAYARNLGVPVKNKNGKFIPIKDLISILKKHKTKKRTTSSYKKKNPLFFDIFNKQDNRNHNTLQKCISHIKKQQSYWCIEHNYPAHKLDPRGKPCINPYIKCKQMKQKSKA